MEEYRVKILGIEQVTHDVKRFTIERPKGYNFKPGQATEVAIDSSAWKNERRPFTFTGFVDDPHLEFTIKKYEAHQGVTEALHRLGVGDHLLIHDVWGAIAYKGKGTFIAGGAGVTPFIAILRELNKDGAIDGNKLIFSNKTKADIILEDEFRKMLDNNFVNVLTREYVKGTHYGRIDKEYIAKNITDLKQHFYICGPEKFVEEIQKILHERGADAEAVVIEK